VLYSINTTDLNTRIQNKDATVKVSKLIETGGDLWSTPLFENGKVYVASLDGNLYALDPRSGEEQWRFSAGKGIVTDPATSGGTMYVGGFGAQLFAVDASTGSQKWAFKASSWVWSRPIIANSRVYFGDIEGHVYALDPSNGEQVWTYDLGKGSIRSAVAVTSSVVVVATEEGWIVGLSPDGKDKRWETKIDTPINADLVLSGDSVLMAPSGCVKTGNDKSYYVSVNPSDGKLTTASGVC